MIQMAPPTQCFRKGCRVHPLHVERHPRVTVRGVTRQRGGDVAHPPAPFSLARPSHVIAHGKCLPVRDPRSPPARRSFPAGPATGRGPDGAHLVLSRISVLAPYVPPPRLPGFVWGTFRLSL